MFLVYKFPASSNARVGIGMKTEERFNLFALIDEVKQVSITAYNWVQQWLNREE